MDPKIQQNLKLGGAAATIAVLAALVGSAATDTEGVAIIKPVNNAVLDYYAAGGRDPNMAKRALSGEPEPTPIALAPDATIRTTDLNSPSIAPGQNQIVTVCFDADNAPVADSLTTSGTFTIGAITMISNEGGSSCLEAIVKNIGVVAARFVGMIKYGAKPVAKPGKVI